MKEKMRSERRRIWNGLLVAVLLTALAFVSVSCVSGATSSGEDWNRTFGGASNDYCWSVWETTNGSYIVAGETESFGAGGTDGWLLKVTANGTPKWNMTFGGPSADRGRSVQQTTDGGYIIAGETDSFGAGNHDLWLLKVEREPPELYTVEDVGVTSSVTLANLTDLTTHLPPGYDGVNLSDAVVLNST